MSEENKFVVINDSIVPIHDEVTVVVKDKILLQKVTSELDKKLTASLIEGTSLESQKLLDDLFPAFNGTVQPVPPWLRFEGGLSLWKPEVQYRRGRAFLSSETYVQLQLKFNVPSSSMHPEEMKCQCSLCLGKKLPAPGEPMDLFGTKTFFAESWVGKTRQQIIGEVMDWLRGIFVHEVLEGLIADDALHYAKEVETYH